MWRTRPMQGRRALTSLRPRWKNVVSIYRMLAQRLDPNARESERRMHPDAHDAVRDGLGSAHTHAVDFVKLLNGRPGHRRQ